MRWIVLGFFMLATAARAEPSAVETALAQAMAGGATPAMGG
jgi:hypothetical protein